MFPHSVATAVLVHLTIFASGFPAHFSDFPKFDVAVDFSNVTFVSRTTTTLQVVTNPILDRNFTYEGKTFANPIHDAAWQSLADLGADLVRFVPWFPYPKKSVAELDAPEVGVATSWAFDNIMPQLEDFMKAVYERNHSTVINFSTQPCWLFNTPNCSYPANPDEAFFEYVRGLRKDLRDPTAKNMSGYYSRLLAYLVKGEFTDENGELHTGGPKYNLSRHNGHVWELFNEGEHVYNQEFYTHDFDVIVPDMIEAAGGYDNAPAFMGIGGASPAWIPYFLNKSSHISPTNTPPIDYVSVHFYASCSNRTDPSTYASGFFGGAESFCAGMDTLIAQRDASDFPDTKYDLDELGVIMPNDNDPSFGIDANLPDIYWNAAGAMYAYLFATLAPKGVEVLGHSQLAGSPKIPEWGIPYPQYPSVSLLDWRTGHGNARYWVLKLLIDHFHSGDSFVSTSVTGSRAPGTNPFCGEVDGPAYGQVTLSCVDPGSVITSVEFADWGTPTGTCQHYAPDPQCSKGPADVAAWAKTQCVGKQDCTLEPVPALGDPCVGVVKRLVVQAECTGPHGGSATTSVKLTALGARSSSGEDKVLLINKDNDSVQAALSFKNQEATVDLYIVDPDSVGRGSPQGIRRESQSVTAPIVLKPFAVVVAVVQP